MIESRTESVAVEGRTVLRYNHATGRMVREFEKIDWPEVLGVERLWRARGPEDVYACYHAAQGLNPWPEKRLIWVAHPLAMYDVYSWLVTSSGVSTLDLLIAEEPTLFGLPVLEGREPGLWLTLQWENLWEKPR